jgi:LysM repeat protein
MKLTHVFGLVAAVHVAAFTIIFATPGCRSSGKTKPRPEQTDPAASAQVDALPVQPVAAMSDADMNAGAPVAYSPVTPVSSSPAAPADAGTRFAPMRPSAAPSAVQAPVAASTAKHTVAKGDSLWAIARQYGVTVAELAAANQLAPSATLRLGQQLSVPAKAAASTSSSAAAFGAPAEVANTYEVKSGDTLGSIARRQGTTIGALRAANNLSGDMLRVGQKLVIPGNATPLGSTPAAPAPAVAPAAPRAATAAAGSYTVVSGDTLGTIARKNGVRVGDIATLNNITDPTKLRVGQVLKLPAAARPAASAPIATPTPAPAAPSAVTPLPLTPRFDDPVSLTPITPVTPVEPVEPITPVEPDAVPVLRIQ